MSNPQEKQFEKDLRANQEASDKLDRELNAPLSNQDDKNPLPPAKVAPPDDKTLVGSKPVTHVVKTRKQEILEEFGGTRSDVPINHPEFWDL